MSGANPVSTHAHAPVVATRPILPGATLGVLGSGQLGRMFAIAARQMGYRVHTFSPDTDTPTGHVADLEIVASYDDLDRVREFAKGVNVVTFEFENVPAATAQAAAEFVPVRPSGDVLHVTQHRLREKQFLSSSGFPVTRFAHVRSAGELREAMKSVGPRAVLKTAGWGYDGKGQIKIQSPEQADAAWASLGASDAVVEAFVAFESEVSVVTARSATGSYADYGVIENRHENHILDLSVTPANVSEKTRCDAQAIARGIVEKLNVVGVLCVEFFLLHDGSLLVNELAPRPHNSGHLTIDACVTSQFEQQVRAACALPLGSTSMHRPGAAMAQLLGDLWQHGEPDWAAALALPDVKLHLYGKSQPRAGRKMGHLTATADTAEQAVALVTEARARLTRAR